MVAFDGFRAFVFLVLSVPFVYLAVEKYIPRFFPDDGGGSESSHGREYYIGYTVGREVFRAEDVPELVRLMQKESLMMKVEKDDGGEKTFLARSLPETRGKGHELEAGLLSGALHRTLRVRFEVDEERCVKRGDGYCRFVAIRG